MEDFLWPAPILELLFSRSSDPISWIILRPCWMYPCCQMELSYSTTCGEVLCGVSSEYQNLEFGESLMPSSQFSLYAAGMLIGLSPQNSEQTLMMQPLGYYRQLLAMEITLGWRRPKAACDGSILDLHHFQVIGIILSDGIGKKR